MIVILNLEIYSVVELTLALCPEQPRMDTRVIPCG